VHAETGNKVLKAQHPEFEVWSQGVHARAGVACADCHNRACQTCHAVPEAEFQAAADLHRKE